MIITSGYRCGKLVLIVPYGIEIKKTGGRTAAAAGF